MPLIHMADMANKCLNVVINKRSLRTFEDCGVKVLFLIMSRTAACLKYADGTRPSPRQLFIIGWTNAEVQEKKELKEA